MAYQFRSLTSSIHMPLMQHHFELPFLKVFPMSSSFIKHQSSQGFSLISQRINLLNMILSTYYDSNPMKSTSSLVTFLTKFSHHPHRETMFEYARNVFTFNNIHNETLLECTCNVFSSWNTTILITYRHVKYNPYLFLRNCFIWTLYI